MNNEFISEPYLEMPISRKERKALARQAWSSPFKARNGGRNAIICGFHVKKECG